MRRYSAVLFDVDGTLIDSAPGILETLRLTFARMGTDVSGVDLRQYMGPPLRRTFGEYYTDPAAVERAVEIYRASYREKGSHMCALYPGVADMLQTLHGAGVALYTATSKPVAVVTPMLEALGIAGFFACIGGASLDAARDTKTDVIRYVLSRRTAADGAALMVGDRRDDMQGARDCGLDAAGVLYGYGTAAELRPFHPVLLAEDCPQLTRFILDGEER